MWSKIQERDGNIVTFCERRVVSQRELFFFKKKAKIEIHHGVNKSKVKSETTNPSNFAFSQIRCWQRAIFPGGGPPSIFASVSLYDRVRDGNGWDPYDLSPANSFS